jgi:hypothetical protein
MSAGAMSDSNGYGGGELRLWYRRAAFIVSSASARRGVRHIKNREGMKVCRECEKERVQGVESKMESGIREVQ